MKALIGNPINKLLPVGVIIIGIAMVGLYSFKIIGPGDRGVLMNFDAVQPGVLNPGLHFLIPVEQSVVSINVRVQKILMKEEAASKDLQDVYSTVIVNYHIEPKDANWVYQHIGRENIIERTVIYPAVANAVKAVTAHYNAEDLIVQRDAVRNKIDAQIKTALSYYHIAVDAVNITNFSFSPQFSAAIERKQIAQQKALQAQYVLQGAIVQAKQKVVTARADAEAMKLKDKSVSPEIIELDAVNRWNGKLPITMVMGQSGGVPLISLMGSK